MEGVSLNLFPFYEKLVQRRQKTMSIRLGDKRDLYKVDDTITLTVGWDSATAPVKARVKITQVLYEQIRKLTPYILEGESPDCQVPAALPYVISAIYRRVVTPYDFVTVVQWEYIENPQLRSI